MTDRDPDVTYRERRRPDAGAILFGLVILVVGAYFLLRNMGVELPSFEWSQVWPVLIVVAGIVVIVQAFIRR